MSSDEDEPNQDLQFSGNIGRKKKHIKLNERLFNDYINKQRFIQGINNTSFHKKDIEKLRNKVSITSMKRDQKIKNKFKRNDAHLFKKKHFKGQKRIK